jgi:tetratricopeptide (TPR) repeat protein
MSRSHRSALAALLCAAACAAVLLARPALAHPGIHEQQRAVAEALADQPNDPAMHLRQGRIHAQQGAFDAALECYERARGLGADPDDVDVVAGAALLDAGWPRMAKLRFAAVLARRPDRHDARLGRARAWMKLDHPEEAAADYAVALERMAEPRPAYALEQRDALLAMGRREEALVALDRAMSRIGMVPTLQLAAVDLALELGRTDDALQRLDLLLAQSPNHPLWVSRRGQVLERAGRTEEARAAYRDALGQLRARSARSRSRRLSALEGELRGALERTPNHLEGTP